MPFPKTPGIGRRLDAHDHLKMATDKGVQLIRDEAARLQHQLERDRPHDVEAAGTHRDHPETASQWSGDQVAAFRAEGRPAFQPNRIGSSGSVLGYTDEQQAVADQMNLEEAAIFDDADPLWFSLKTAFMQAWAKSGDQRWTARDDAALEDLQQWYHEHKHLAGVR